MSQQRTSLVTLVAGSLGVALAVWYLHRSGPRPQAVPAVGEVPSGPYRLPPRRLSVSAASVLEQSAALRWPPLYPRALQPTPDAARHGAASFTVMQFNTLAEGLSSGPEAPTPFAGETGGSYGGFDAVDRECLDWSRRRLRLVEEVLRYKPDILALEEVDRFPDFFQPVLESAGYDGVFGPKGHAPGLRYGFYSDGTALFWRRDAFAPDAPPEVLYCRERDGRPGNRPYIIGALRSLRTSGAVLVGATHLKAKPGATNEAARVHDISQVLDTLAARGAALPSGSHTVLLGDFNTDPYDVPGEHEAQAVPAVLAHPLALQSAYPLPCSGRDGGWTTWKRRGAAEIKHTIDYIFHSANLRVTGLLAPPKDADLEPARLPGFRYPSDHLAIMAEFAPSNGTSR